MLFQDLIGLSFVLMFQRESMKQSDSCRHFNIHVFTAGIFRFLCNKTSSFSLSIFYALLIWTFSTHLTRFTQWSLSTEAAIPTLAKLLVEEKLYMDFWNEYDDMHNTISVDYTKVITSLCPSRSLSSWSISQLFISLASIIIE